MELQMKNECSNCLRCISIFFFSLSRMIFVKIPSFTPCEF